ncbi:glycerophosphodiester phosphodiesterase family protein [Paenibacillus oceani]|uniref:Glycerophosphodiester phosphodiesterase family protein n=1 Tax=Paenibacillus oceani TaxID=2772510 RepID=A0A927GZP7_9BACL|nr:glycerophosphodiester phosphodiesterase family protein [Paenibacillus oceani]MBD2862307.1 glycerophosphodiester phosphodiesterase family protein [Paenibacillus oceani]
MNKGSALFLADHRGCWNEAPENSLAAIQDSMNNGIYIIEIDVQQTKDGYLILMHDSTVDRMTNGTGKVSELKLEDIQRLNLKSRNGRGEAVLTEERIPTLEQALSLIKGKALANLDKCWHLREQVVRLLEQTDCMEHALLKSRANVEEVNHFLSTAPSNLNYMHKINESNYQELDFILEVINPVAIEIGFTSDNSPVLQEVFRKRPGVTMNIWVNALDGSKNGGHNDSLSLINPDQGWGWLLKQNVNIIQTDYSSELMRYIKTLT